MRGLAALTAGVAAWVIVTGRVPAVRLPTVRLPPAWVLPTSLIGGLAVGALALGALEVPAAAAAIGMLAAAIPFAIAAARRRGEQEAMADAWPDFLAYLRGRVVSGTTIPEAFVDAARRSPEPLRGAAMEVEMATMYGDGFGSALQTLRLDLMDATADRVLVTLETAHGSGGQRVGEILTALAVSVADELRLRKAHWAALTEQRMTAAVALIAPWALLALTIATNPQASLVYRTSTGVALIVAGLVLTGVGYLLAMRTASLSRSPRVFE